MALFRFTGFQCRNGHSACSACCKTLKKGCPTCAQPVGTIRNKAIESIIKSLQLDCKHAVLGCNRKLPYSDRRTMEEHENKLCEFRPVQCPVQIPGSKCSHSCPKFAIPSHLSKEHDVLVKDCLASTTTSFKMRANCPMTMVRTEHAWLLVNCWNGCYNFGSYIFCSVFGNPEATVWVKLSLERVWLREREKIYLTFTALQAVAESHNDIDMASISLNDILVGPYLNIPHEDHEAQEMELELEVTFLRKDEGSEMEMV